MRLAIKKISHHSLISSSSALSATETVNHTISVIKKDRRPSKEMKDLDDMSVLKDKAVDSDF